MAFFTLFLKISYLHFPDTLGKKNEAEQMSSQPPVGKPRVITKMSKKIQEAPSDMYIVLNPKASTDAALSKMNVCLVFFPLRVRYLISYNLKCSR